MIVDSYLELYTTLFGWMWYGTIWNVLKDTGLLFLPFFGIILDHYLKYRKGFEDGDSEELTLRSLEVDLVLALAVLLFAGVPFFNLNAEEISYTPPALYPNASQESLPEWMISPNESKATDSEATYGNNSFNSYPDTVKVPVWWSWVMAMVNGISRSVMEDIPPTISIRYYVEQLRDVKIESPVLKQEVEDFYRDCYVKAKSKLLRERPDYETYAVILNTHGVDDLHWPGSRTYQALPGYYDTLRSEKLHELWDYVEERDLEWEAPGPANGKGRPYCNQWWNGDADTEGLQERITDEIGILKNIQSHLEFAVNEDVREDNLTKVVFQNDPPVYTPRGYDFTYNKVDFDADDSIQFSTNLKSFASKIQSAWASLGAEMDTIILLNGGHQFQALIIMVIVTFLPFVLFLGKFSLTVILVAAWAIFTIKFFTVIWFLVWWLDQNLWAAMYPNPGDITRSVLFLESGEKQLLLNYMVNVLFYAGPLIFVFISSWGGYQLIGGLSKIQNVATSGMQKASDAPIKLADRARR